MRVLRVLWTRWQVVGRKIADVQARVLLVVFYFAVFGPFALVVKRFSDPLRLHAAARNWLQRRAPEGEPLTLARRQF